MRSHSDRETGKHSDASVGSMVQQVAPAMPQRWQGAGDASCVVLCGMSIDEAPFRTT